ncbi:MAG: hypothetical protein V4510_05135 [bacterium]
MNAASSGPNPARQRCGARRRPAGGCDLASFRASEVVIHPDLDAAFRRIEAEAAAGRQPSAAIWKSLLTAFQRAKTSAQFADPIPPRRIPAHVRRYGLANLYCVDLADFHRGFYTLEGRRVIFLDVVDHRQYDEWFPNKGR